MSNPTDSGVGYSEDAMAEPADEGIDAPASPAGGRMRRSAAWRTIEQLRERHQLKRHLEDFDQDVDIPEF